jgi:hypothetical protein
MFGGLFFAVGKFPHYEWINCAGKRFDELTLFGDMYTDALVGKRVINIGLLNQ